MNFANMGNVANVELLPVPVLPIANDLETIGNWELDIGNTGNIGNI